MSNSIQGVYQGSFMLLDEIRVSPLSRAYTFSDSIYEVIPYYSGKPLCLDEHIDRFKVSADFLKIKLDFSVVRKEIEQLGRSVENYTNALSYALLLDSTEFADRGVILSGQIYEIKEENIETSLEQYMKILNDFSYSIYYEPIRYHVRKIQKNEIQ